MKPTITLTLNRSTFLIAVLSLTALVLLTVVLINPVKADFAVKERDYQLIDVPSNTGSDALYVIDNKTGNCLVFTWDVNRRALAVVGGLPIPNAFK